MVRHFLLRRRALEAVRDLAEDSANLRPHQDEDGNDHDSYQGDDERVLDQTLALLRSPKPLPHTTFPSSYTPFTCTRWFPPSPRLPCSCRNLLYW